MHARRSPASTRSTARMSPTRRNTSSARTVGRNGAGATWRPISSSSTASSTGPSPTPPSASGHGDPEPALVDHGRPEVPVPALRGLGDPRAPGPSGRGRRGAPGRRRGARAGPPRGRNPSARGHYLTSVSPLFRRCTPALGRFEEPDTKEPAVQDEKPAYFRHGDTEIELPIVRGTRERARRRHLQAAVPDRRHHARLRLHEHRRVRVGDHLHRRRRRDPALPRRPDRAARRARRAVVPRDVVPPDLRRAPDPRRSSTSSASGSAATRSCTKT